VFIVDPIPLTGVGKIFKPELRNRAARRVYSQVVAAIAGEAAQPQVDIGPDPVHGTLVSVTLTPLGHVDEVERRVREALGRFTCAYRITWRNKVRLQV